MVQNPHKIISVNVLWPDFWTLPVRRSKHNFNKRKNVSHAHVNLCHFSSSSWCQGLTATSACGSSWTFLVIFFFVIIKLFLRKTCLDGVSIKLNNFVSYTYAIVNIRASARDYLSFRKLLQTTFENLTRDIYSLAMISKNIRKKVKTEHICLFFVCLFVCLFIYLFIYLFSFFYFFFFLSFFLPFILSLLIYWFILKLSCIINVFWLATPSFSKLGITW